MCWFNWCFVLKNLPSGQIEHLKDLTSLWIAWCSTKLPLWEKVFLQKSNLVRHQATHSEIRSFKCSICPEGRFFKTKNQLTNHMVFHYEPKFACSHCDYRAHKKCDLDRHSKTHEKKIK